MPVDARKDSMKEQKERAQKDRPGSKDLQYGEKAPTGTRGPTALDRKMEQRRKDAAAEQAAAKGPIGAKKDVTQSLPPGLNPLKYSPNPTPEVPATLENLTTLVTENLPIVGNVIKGVKMLTDEEYDPINPYGQPTGTAPGYTADPSQIGETAGMGVDGTLERASPVQKKKKKVEAKPGFTLLQGAGGTLLGG